MTKLILSLLLVLLPVFAQSHKIRNLEVRGTFKHALKASDPPTCAVGEEYLNTVTGKLRLCWTTNSWEDSRSGPSGVNVKKYGATGDGTTDDTAAIAAANAAVAATGGELYFPRGTYRITSAIAIKPYVAYVGEFYNTKIVSSAGGFDVGAGAGGVTYFEIRNLEIQGGGSGIGVNLSRATTYTNSFEMEGVRIHGFTTGVKVGDAFFAHFNDVWAYSNTGDGFLVQPGTYITTLRFDGVKSYDNGGIGFNNACTGRDCLINFVSYSSTFQNNVGTDVKVGYSDNSLLVDTYTETPLATPSNAFDVTNSQNTTMIGGYSVRHANTVYSTGGTHNLIVENATLVQGNNGTSKSVVLGGADNTNIFLRGGLYGAAAEVTATNYKLEGIYTGITRRGGGFSDDGITVSMNEVLQLANGPGAKPSCDATQRKKLWFVEGGAGVADTVEICSKAIDDTYAWRPLI